MNKHASAFILLIATGFIALLGVMLALHDFTAARTIIHNLNEEQNLPEHKQEEQQGEVAGTTEHFQEALIVISAPDVSFSTYAAITHDTTAENLLETLKEEGQITLKTTPSDLGVFIEEINGIPNDKKTNTYWFLYRNGESATQGASALKVQPGDTIEWRYHAMQ